MEVPLPEGMWDQWESSMWGPPWAQAWSMCSSEALVMETETEMCVYVWWWWTLWLSLTLWDWTCSLPWLFCSVAKLCSPPLQCGASGYHIQKCDFIFILVSKNNCAAFLSQAVHGFSGPCSLATYRMSKNLGLFCLLIMRCRGTGSLRWPFSFTAYESCRDLN